MEDAREKYSDIIDREYRGPQWHKPMPKASRAAQFSPFAALTGYDDLVGEAARLTDAQTDVSEDGRQVLDEAIAWILAQKPAPEAAFTVFVPDKKKEGGAYETVTGRVAKHDPVAQTLVLTDRREIPAAKPMRGRRAPENKTEKIGPIAPKTTAIGPFFVKKRLNLRRKRCKCCLHMV